MEKYMERSEYGGRHLSRVLCRVAGVLFALFIILCVAIGVTLIFTQKPVDLSPPSLTRRLEGHLLNGSYASSSSSLSPMRSRTRKFPENYRKFSFDDLTSTNSIVRMSYDVSWLTDGSGVINRVDDSQVESETLNIIQPATFDEREFINERQFTAGFNSKKVKFSSSGKYVAIFKGLHYAYRHSREAIYQIAKLSNGKFVKHYFVGPTGSGTEVIQELTWNPNPNFDDFVFVSGHSVFYQADPEQPGTAKQLTQNGSDYVRYGIADWLYEEDVFGSSLAHWWSRSGGLLAYIKFDDQDVNKVFIKRYYENMQYPEYKPIPYPKAGVREQPRVKLYIWNKTTAVRVVIRPPAQLENQSYYIFSCGWLPATAGRDERLVTVWANRRQSRIFFTLCNEADCIMSYEQSYTIGSRRLWAQPSDLQALLPSATGFFALLPATYDDGNIYNHVTHIQVAEDGTGKVTATHGGPYDVMGMLGYDPSSDSVFYNGMGGGIASNRFYRISRASSRDSATIHCLSCSLPQCDASEASVSPDGRRAFVHCKQAFKDTRLYLMNTASPKGARKLRGDDSTTLSFEVPKIRHESIRLPSGIDAHVGLMLPPKLDPSLRYPLFLNVYGGPTAYMNSLEIPWDFLLHLCSSEHFIIAYVDGRGSGNRGWNIKEPVNERLGVPETIDQIDAIKELLKKYDYIDPNSVSVFGWSYGGFMSTHIAVRDLGQTFRCALAVAPVTDFALYDSAYTERYLGMPDENMSGYNNSRLIDKVERLTNVSYFLAHGEADDNVHYQHSALLSQALQTHGIHFTQLVYANQDHSMATIRQHLYKEVIRFLGNECVSSS